MPTQSRGQLAHGSPYVRSTDRTVDAQRNADRVSAPCRRASAIFLPAWTRPILRRRARRLHAAGPSPSRWRSAPARPGPVAIAGGIVDAPRHPCMSATSMRGPRTCTASPACRRTSSRHGQRWAHPAGRRRRRRTAAASAHRPTRRQAAVALTTMQRPTGADARTARQTTTSSKSARRSARGSREVARRAELPADERGRAAGRVQPSGGILDVYSPDAEAPFRIEFFGDDIDSLRQFSPQTQRSLGDASTVDQPTARPTDRQALMQAPAGHLTDYLPT